MVKDQKASISGVKYSQYWLSRRQHGYSFPRLIIHYTTVLTNHSNLKEQQSSPVLKLSLLIHFCLICFHLPIYYRKSTPHASSGMSHKGTEQTRQPSRTAQSRTMKQSYCKKTRYNLSNDEKIIHVEKTVNQLSLQHTADSPQEHTSNIKKKKKANTD